MPLEHIKVPVLVVHHQQDGCSYCAYSEIPNLMAKLTHTPRSHLITATGGKSQGDACAAFAHHGFNGLEADVVGQMADWILAPAR